MIAINIKLMVLTDKQRKCSVITSTNHIAVFNAYRDIVTFTLHTPRQTLTFSHPLKFVTVCINQHVSFLRLKATISSCDDRFKITNRMIYGGSIGINPDVGTVNIGQPKITTPHQQYWRYDD